MVGRTVLVQKLVHRTLFRHIVLLLYVAAVSCSREDTLIGYSEQTNVVVLESRVGDIHVALLETIAPKTCQLVKELAEKGCTTCHFYRNEMPPMTGLGPPYALLQGSLDELSAVPPREDTTVARKGNVCMIPGSKEFFIAAADHDEWGSAHTVFGKVSNMTAVGLLLQQPFHLFVHPTYGTEMRMLDKKESFAITAFLPT